MRLPVATALLLAGRSASPPAIAPPQVREVAFRAPAAALWRALLETLRADSLRPLALDSSSGFLSTAERLTPTAEARADADCGRNAMGVPLYVGQVFVRVVARLRSVSDTTELRLETFWRRLGPSGGVLGPDAVYADCVSRGTLERRYLDAIRARLAG